MFRNAYSYPILQLVWQEKKLSIGWHSMHQARKMTNYISTDEADLRYSEPPKNTSKTRCPILCLDSQYDNQKSSERLTVNDNRSCWECQFPPPSSHRQKMPLLDFRPSDLGNQTLPHSSTCSHTSHYCRRALVVDSRFSRNQHVRGPAFAWEASRPCYLSGNNTSENLLHF
jgi:hypothetical protein